jgi:hypothetical protein
MLDFLDFAKNYSFPNQKLHLLMEDTYDTALDDTDNSANGGPAFCALRSLD